MPSSNSGFVAVAAGGYHSLGLKADGGVTSTLWAKIKWVKCKKPGVVKQLKNASASATKGAGAIMGGVS